MKQRYHYNVANTRVEQHVEKGNDDGLYISSVACCSELWGLIMDAGTGFTAQVGIPMPADPVTSLLLLPIHIVCISVPCFSSSYEAVASKMVQPPAEGRAAEKLRSCLMPHFEGTSPAVQVRIACETLLHVAPLVHVWEWGQSFCFGSSCLGQHSDATLIFN